MKIKRFIFFIAGFALISFHTLGQIKDSGKRIILTTIGSDNSKQIAKDKALKSSLFQVLSLINVKSDSLLILESLLIGQLMLSSNNCFQYYVENENELPNGVIVVTLKVSISIEKFSETLRLNGIQFDFKGDQTVLLIKQQILNEKVEFDTILEMIGLLHEPMQTVFDYKIKKSLPKSLDEINKDWAIPLRVQVVTNKNIDKCFKFLFDTINSLKIDTEEIIAYENMNKKQYRININYLGLGYQFNLRNKASIRALNTFINNWEYYLWNFSVNDGSIFYHGNSNKIIEFNPNLKLDLKEKKESIANAKKDYQYTLNQNEETSNLNLMLTESLQFVGEFSWFDRKNLAQLDLISNYTIKARGPESKYKNGGYVFKEENGIEYIVSLCDLGLMNYNEAKTFISQLNLNGFQDWRIPTYSEFLEISKSLILSKIGNFSQRKNDSQKLFYWTSTPSESYYGRVLEVFGFYLDENIYYRATQQSNYAPNNNKAYMADISDLGLLRPIRVNKSILEKK